MPQARRGSPPSDHAAAGVARRRARRHRLRAVRDRLLPALVPAGADRRHRPRRREPERPSARSASRRRAATSWTATRRALVRTKKAAVVQLVPSTLPEAGAQGRPTTTARRWPRPRPSGSRYERQLRRARPPAQGRRAQDDQGRARERARLKKLGATARKVAIPPIPADEPELAELYRRIGETIDIRPKTIHERVIRSIADTPYSNVTVRTDVPLAQFNYMRERPEYFEGVVVDQALPARVPRGQARRAAVRHGLRDQQPSRSDRAQAQGRRAGHADRAERPRVPATTSTCAARTARRASSSTRSAPATSERRLVGDRAQAGPAAAADDRHATCRRRASGRSRRRSRTPSTRRAPARSWPWTRATARSSRWARRRRSTRAVRQAVHAAARYEYLTSDATDAPLLNRATESGVSVGVHVQAGRRRMAALEEGLITPSRKIDDPGHWEYGGRDYQNAKEAVFGTSTSARRSRRSPRTSSSSSSARRPTTRAASSSAGPSGSATAARRASTCRARSPASCPDRKWREAGFAEYREVRREGRRARADDRRRCSSAAASSARGPAATTSTSRSARATCRPRRCRWPSPTPRSRTAARSCARTSARRSRTATASRCRSSAPRPRRKVKIAARDRDAVLDGLRARRPGRGRHVRGRVRRAGR